jgi:hypothetical protein
MAVLNYQGLTLKQAGVAVGQIIAMDRSGLEAMTMETTDLATVGGKTYKWNGLTESGTVSGTLHFDPDLATQTTIEVALKAGTEQEWIITYTDTTPETDTFQAIVTKFDITGSLGEKVEATFELKITGDITRA